MKRLLVLLLAVTYLTLTSQNASALIMNDGSGIHESNPVLQVIVTTTSFPTVIVDDFEIEIDSEEGYALLIQEACGDDEETPLSDVLAESLKVDAEDILESVRDLYENEEEVNIENIINKI